MVAIFTGLGAGFVRSSANILGGAGQLGSAGLGRGSENVSVNAATGNLLIAHKDEFLIGKGPDASISRTYNSIQDASGGDRDNGDQWRQSTTKRVFELTGAVNSAGSTIKRMAGDGSVITYGWGTKGGVDAYWTTEGTGSHDKLSWDGSNWIWTDGDSRVTETYQVSYGNATEYRLTELTDIDGNKLTYSYYASSNRLDKVTTQDGSWVKHYWSGDNLTKLETGYTDYATSTAETLTRVLYGYDGSNRLTSVTTDLSPDDNSVADGNKYVTTYTYDGTSNRIATITQTDGSSVAIAYDASGRVTSLTQSVAAGDTRVTSIAYNSSYTVITTPDGNQVKLVYNPYNQLNEIWRNHGEAHTQRVAAFAYDSSGNVTQVTDADNNITTYNYDANGNLTISTDANGNTVKHWYTADNRVWRTRTYGEANYWGTDPASANVAQYTRYAYDGEGHLRYKVGPDGRVTEHYYDASGELSRTVQYTEDFYGTGTAQLTLADMNAWRDGLADRTNILLTDYLRDGRGNLTEIRSHGISNSDGSISWADIQTREYFTYDQSGKLLERHLQAEASETFVYDGMGRLTGSVAADGSTTSIVFQDSALKTVITTTGASGDHVVTKTYNKAGELVSSNKTAGWGYSSTETAAYDKLGRLRYAVDGAGFKSYFVYDDKGRLVGEINHHRHLIEYQYDDQDRVVGTGRYYNEGVSAAQATALEDPDNTLTLTDLRPAINHNLDIWSWSVYDAKGRVLQSIDGMGGVTEFTYDKSDRVVKTVQYYNTASVSSFKTSPPTGPVAVTANSAKDVLTRTFYYRNGDVLATLDAEGYFTRYYYDYARQVTAEQRFSKQVTESLWANGLFKQLYNDVSSSANRLVRSVYDGRGLLRFQINDAKQVTEFVYNSAGKVTTTIAYASALTGSDYTYDTVKTQMATKANDNTDRESFSVYNANGQLAYTIDTSDSVSGYTYNSHGELTKVTQYATARSTGSLPSIGTMDSWASGQASNANNRVTRNFYTADGLLRYSVDGEGYVIRHDYNGANDNTRLVMWDTPIAVTDSSTISTVHSLVDGTSWVDVQYSYDAYGVGAVYDGEGNRTSNPVRRSGFRVGEYRGHYTDDESQTNAENDAAGRVISIRYALGESERSDVDYTYDGIGNRLTVNDGNGNTTTYTYDRRGLVTQIQNSAGTTSYEYNAFGEVVKTTDANGNRTYSYYDDLGRTTMTVDAIGYVDTYAYNSFGDLLTHKRYELSVWAADTSAVDAAYANAAALQTTADNLAAQATADAANAASLQQQADALSAEAADLLAAANSYQAQANSYNSTLTTQFNAFWSSLASDISSLQSQISALNAQINALYQQAAADPYNAQYYAMQAYALEAQRNVLQAELSDLQALQSSQGSYSVGDPLPQASDYTATLNAKNAAQADADQAMADYNATLSAANSKQSQANAAVTTANNSANAAAAAQASADQALADAQALDAATQATVSTSDPVVDINQLGSAATTSFTYDVAGRLTKTTDAEGFYETYTYNAFGERASVNAKSETTSVSAGSNNTTSYIYDRRGLLVAETLPVESYDENGTLISSTVTNRYEYDARGNRTKMIQADGLAEELVTEYVYDKANRLIETKLPVFLNKATSNHITYDGRGNVTSTTNGAGNRTVFYYDDLDRKVIEISPTGTYTKYTYDKNSNVTKIEVFDNTVSVPADGGSEEEAPAVPGGNSRVTTFTYDALNRMTKSSVADIRVGWWNGSTWYGGLRSLDTLYTYDANGNVTSARSPRGYYTYSYYDQLGRKIAQVDSENYLTSWEYNSEGNVLKETRFWNKVSGTPPTGGTPPSVTGHGNDRVTEYTYDQNGNRLNETRKGVKIHNGTGGTTTVDASVSYLYNGLGQVVRKTEATGEQTNYKYDDGGRLIEEKKASFTSHQNATVTPEVDYYYNGRGDLARTVAAGAGNAAARVTRYVYDGDKLRQVIDAESKITRFSYDNAGLVSHADYIRRHDSAGAQTANYEATLYIYDAAGREIQQRRAAHDGSAWVDVGPRTYTTYNAHGDVVAVKTGNVSTAQVQNKYDEAGRLWATTAGDGIWKFFGYGKDGEQTLAITSAGYDMSGITSIDAALALVSRTDVNATYTQYDKRNSATKVVEEQRQLTGSGTSTLNTSRTYNAFGEVSTETNAAGAKITYTYNNMGKMVRSESPAVSITLEDGTSRWVKPSEDYYYDASGRLVAQRDANGSYASGGTNASNAKSKAANTGNLTELELLAGSGYDGSQALVTKEIHADGGIKQTKYDIHGDARTLIDEVNRTTTQTFDKMGRLLQANRAGGLIDYYRYDELGQQTQHWNNLTGSGNKETTDYDALGRVIKTRAFGGDITQYAYGWSNAYEAAGTGQTDVGGWQKITTMANSKTLTERTDVFGRAIYKNDLGGHVTNYTYDTAGRLTKSEIGTTSYNYEYYNTGQVKRAFTTAPDWRYYKSSTSGVSSHVVSTATTQSATYTYDAVGNRLTELGTLTHGSTSVSWKNHTASYDALGRLTQVVSAQTDTHQASDVTFTYDANGNVRSKHSIYRVINANGSYSSSSGSGITAWYRYDNMNRVVINNGKLLNDVIQRKGAVSVDFIGDPSQEIQYNKAGQRTLVDTSKYRSDYVELFDPYMGTSAGWHTITYSSFIRESYTYDSAGRVYQVHSGEASLDAQAYGMAQIMGYSYPEEYFLTAPSTLKKSAQYTYDNMGRQTVQYGYATNGTTVIHHATTSYNAKGQVTSSYSSTLREDNKTYASTTTYQYGSGSSYALGAATQTSSTSTVNGGSSTTTTLNSTFYWWDGAVQKKTTKSGTTDYTEYYYNDLGQMTRARIVDGKTRTVTFSLDEVGQIIRRDETNVSGQTGAPHEVWFRMGDREIGYVGNNGGQDPSTRGSLEQMQQVSPGTGTFQNGTTTSRNYVGYAEALDPINAYEQGGRVGGYTVKSGDNLQSIAKALYGDAGLWYKIAEANGLSGSSSLVQGQQLVLPAGVTRNTYTADSFRPYDPAQAIGDLSPTAPEPPKDGGKCGVFGQILLAAISIAVSIALPGGGTIIGGMVNAAIGSAVSQAVGVATGIQEKFSFKGVALSALSAGVASGLGEIGAFSKLGIAGGKGVTGVLNGAARGALSSAITQGIGVATGLQDKFSFAGVAAAGVSGGIGQALGGKLDPLHGKGSSQSFSNIAGHAAVGAARLLGSAATRSAIQGTSFGASIMAGLPDVIGQVLGAAFSGALEKSSSADQSSSSSGRTRIDVGASKTTAIPPAQLTAQLRLIEQDLSVESPTSARPTQGAAIEAHQEGASTSNSGGGSAEPANIGDTIYVTADRNAGPDWAVAPYGDFPGIPSDGNVVPWRQFFRDTRAAYTGQARRDFMHAFAQSRFGGLETAEERMLAAMELGMELMADTRDDEFGRRIISEMFYSGVADPVFGDEMLALNRLMDVYDANLDSMADRMLFETAKDIGRVWLQVGGTVFTPLGAADALIAYHNGEIGGAELALSLVPGSKAVRALDEAVDAARGAERAGQFRDVNGRLREANGRFAFDGGPSRTSSTGGTHGNTAGNQQATLYERYAADGTFLKHGISQNPSRRYTNRELDGGYLIETRTGPRSEILQIERELVETRPGPLNREPWAGARSGD